MTTAPMTAGEQGTLIDYARRFGFAVGHKYPRFRDDIVSASLLGAAVAFASPDFPAEVEGRRKFLGQCCWNLIRRELTRCTRKQPILFTDVEDLDPAAVAVDPHRYDLEAEWADEFEALAASFVGVTAAVFRLTYGGIRHTRAEVAAQVGRSAPDVQYHLTKIKLGARRRHERMERIG